MTTELVPEQILPKMMRTFGLTAAYVFIICWVTGSSVMAAGGSTAIPMWILGILTFLVPAGMAVVELGNLWPGQGGVYIWASRTMGETWGFIGGYLSSVPVILRRCVLARSRVASSCSLRSTRSSDMTTSVILRMVVLWTVIRFALATRSQPTHHEHGVRRLQRPDADDLQLSGLGSTPVRTVRLHRSAGTRPRFPTSPPRDSFRHGAALLARSRDPDDMRAEFLSVRESGPKMNVWGSAALVAIYL